MKSAVRKARSKSPYRRPRKAEELLGEIRDFEEQQRLISLSPERPEQTVPSRRLEAYQPKQRGGFSSCGIPEESAAIEVVLEVMSAEPAQSETPKRKPIPAPLVTPDVAELGTISTASSSEGGDKATSARKSFKEKYMVPPREAALEFANRRCFPFNHVGQMQQPKLPPSTPPETASRVTGSSSPATPPSSSQSRSATPGRSRSRGRPVTRVPFRAPQPTPETPQKVNAITPTRSRRPDSFLVLSPNREMRRRSRGGSVKSSATTPRASSKTRQRTSTPPESTEGTDDFPGNSRNSKNGPRKLIESPIKPARPKILSLFTGNVVSKSTAKTTNAKLSFTHNRPIQQTAKMDEKKEEEEPPAELMIPAKSESPISFLRSKPSMLSEISNPSNLKQEDSIGAVPDTEVKRVLRSIEGSLAEAAKTGKHIDRLTVYRTLLEVSDSLESPQEREAMQRELTLLMENSELHAERLEDHLLLGVGNGQEEDEPSVKKMVRIQSPQPADIQVTPTMYTNLGEEDSWTVDTYGSQSQTSKDDTVNFLQEMFGFGFWGSKKGKPEPQEDDGISTQEDWSEFMEDHGLKINTAKNSRRNIPMLRTYSEETGFTEESAFVSRASKASRSPSFQSVGHSSSSSGGSPSGVAQDKQKRGKYSSSNSKSWWRQEKDDSPSSASRSTASVRENSARLSMGSKAPQKQLSRTNLVDPAMVNQPRGTRRRSTTVSPPRRRQGFGTKSNENAASNQSSKGTIRPLRKPSGAGSGHEDTMSLSSIESNQYDRYATDFFDLGGGSSNLTPPIPPSARDGRGSTRRPRQRSKSLDGRRNRRI